MFIIAITRTTHAKAQQLTPKCFLAFIPATYFSSDASAFKVNLKISDFSIIYFVGLLHASTFVNILKMQQEDQVNR